MQDALLAYLHFFTLFAAFALLVAELVVLQAMATPGKWSFLSLLDMGYFAAAIGIVITGLCRVFFGFKPAVYYWHEPYFHALWGTFLFIGVLSSVPTFYFIRWAKAARRDPSFTPDPRALRHVRGHLMFEILLFCLAPLFAVLMARGYGM